MVDGANSESTPQPVEVSKTSIEEPDSPIVWPHKAGKLWHTAKLMASNYAKSGKDGPFASQLATAKRMMGEINGRGTEELVDKYQFIETVRKIGYPAQKQVLVSSTKQTSEDRLYAVAGMFPDPEQSVICKPHDSVGGLGIVEMRVGDLEGFLTSMGQDYIIQENVDHEAEIRYVREIDTSSDQILRIYDEKDIPKIQGDGTKTKGKLIRGSQMPLSAKIVTGVRNITNLGTVVPEEGKIHASRLGVPKKENLEWRPENRQRVENMDRFMRHFLTDLQTRIGHSLPLLCFDIGVKDISLLDQEYESDEALMQALKPNFVFFECQFPFTLAGYVWRSAINSSGESESGGAKPTVLIYPGLETSETKESAKRYETYVKMLRPRRFNFVVKSARWKDQEETIEEKEIRIRQEIIDEALASGRPVGVVALSGSGPELAKVTHDLDNSVVGALVTIAAPMDARGMTFDNLSMSIQEKLRRQSPRFVEFAQQLMQDGLPELTETEIDRMLNIYGERDTSVPPEYSELTGADNRQFWTPPLPGRLGILSHPYNIARELRTPQLTKFLSDKLYNRAEVNE